MDVLQFYMTTVHINHTTVSNSTVPGYGGAAGDRLVPPLLLSIRPEGLRATWWGRKEPCELGERTGVLTHKTARAVRDP